MEKKIKKKIVFSQLKIGSFSNELFPAISPPCSELQLLGKAVCQAL